MWSGGAPISNGGPGTTGPPAGDGPAKALWITLYVIMAFYIVCHNGAQYSLERGHKYLNSFQTLYNVGRTV